MDCPGHYHGLLGPVCFRSSLWCLSGWGVRRISAKPVDVSPVYPDAGEPQQHRSTESCAGGKQMDWYPGTYDRVWNPGRGAAAHTDYGDSLFYLRLDLYLSPWAC